MERLIARLKTLTRDEDSPSMVEYGLLLALIVLTVAIVAGHLGENTCGTR